MPEVLSLRSAVIEDVPLLVELECHPENSFVHSNSAEDHKKGILDRQNLRYFIAETDQKKAMGYAILALEKAATHSADGKKASETLTGRVEFRRVVIAEKGKGIGTIFIQAILKRMFANQDIGHIWLDVYEENVRAQHVYKKLGFETIEVNRDNVHPEYGGLIIMELSRDRYMRHQA